MEEASGEELKKKMQARKERLEDDVKRMNMGARSCFIVAFILFSLFVFLVHYWDLPFGKSLGVLLVGCFFGPSLFKTIDSSYSSLVAKEKLVETKRVMDLKPDNQTS